MATWCVLAWSVLIMLYCGWDSIDQKSCTILTGNKCTKYSGSHACNDLNLYDWIFKQLQLYMYGISLFLSDLRKKIKNSIVNENCFGVTLVTLSLMLLLWPQGLKMFARGCNYNLCKQDQVSFALHKNPVISFNLFQSSYLGKKKKGNMSVKSFIWSRENLVQKCLQMNSCMVPQTYSLL